MRSVVWTICVIWQLKAATAARLRLRALSKSKYGPQALTEGLEPDLGHQVLEEEEVEEESEGGPEQVHFAHPLHGHALPPCPICGHHCGGSCGGGGGGNNLNLALLPHNGGTTVGVSLLYS